MVYVLYFIGFKTKLKYSIKDQGQGVIFCGVNGVGVVGSQLMPKTGPSFLRNIYFPELLSN